MNKPTRRSFLTAGSAAGLAATFPSRFYPQTSDKSGAGLPVVGLEGTRTSVSMTGWFLPKEWCGAIRMGFARTESGCWRERYLRFWIAVAGEKSENKFTDQVFGHGFARHDAGLPCVKMRKLREFGDRRQHRRRDRSAINIERFELT